MRTITIFIVFLLKVAYAFNSAVNVGDVTGIGKNTTLYFGNSYEIFLRIPATTIIPSPAATIIVTPSPTASFSPSPTPSPSIENSFVTCLSSNFPGDFNADGYYDILVTCNIKNLTSTSVYLIYGYRNFPSIIYLNTIEPYLSYSGDGISTFIQDMNGDHIVDMTVLVTHSPESDFIVVNLSNGCRIKITSHSGEIINMMQARDLNGDGLADIPVVTESSIYVVYGSTDLTVDKTIYIDSGTTTYST